MHISNSEKAIPHKTKNVSRQTGLIALKIQISTAAASKKVAGKKKKADALHMEES